MTARWAILAAMAGCGGIEEQHGTALEGFRFGWVDFNHRVSAITVEPGLEESEVVVIGGTSTTNQFLEPPPCDPATCREFPASDEAEVEVRWAVVDSTKTAYVPATVTLEVGRDGASATAEATLPDGAKGDGTALLSGMSLSTAHPLSGGDACYDPAYGWHLRQLTITLGEVTVADGVATVPVDAVFSAGKALDDARACIDEVNDQAIVDLSVTVLVVVGKGDVESQSLTAGAQYPFSGDVQEPEAQDDPAPTTLSWTIEDPLLGFSSIDFRFDPDRDDDRGAYLRTLGFWAAPDGTANAIATNYSPLTQLQDFGYTFEGEVRAIEHRGTLTRGTATGTVGAELDDEGAPVVHPIEH